MHDKRIAPIIVGVSALLQGCSAEVNSRYLVIPDRNQPQWLINATESAVNFWTHHEVQASLGAGGFTAVEDSDLIRQQDWGQCGQGLLYLSPELADKPEAARCVVAHEMGHAFGMRHVKEPRSLMFTYPLLPEPEGSCWWSADDQVELKWALETGHIECP